MALALLINLIFISAAIGLVQTGKSLENLPLALLGIIIFDAFFWLGISQQLNQLKWLLNHVREHFIYGCVNPGVVVASNPPLVAVLTNLSTGRQQHYVIKILPQPLRWIKNGIPSVGTKLATVALYQGSGQKGSWDDFHPIAINCVTDDPTDIERVFQSIPAWEWKHLEMGFDYIQETKPGLYNVPFVHCGFCHEIVFFSHYASHRAEHTKRLQDGQMTDHITVPPEQRYQGTLDAVPQTYFHPHCEVATQMPETMIRSYLVNPFLYGEYTFCCGCHDYVLQHELYWCETGQCLMDYFQELKDEYVQANGDVPPRPLV
ncbi:DUF3239 domain-containing protein [Oscillatoria sp. FACHB-1407]|uniref:DUF3239 domain-containing protein n=1 Tax=Oscillatoria sp. FACHB-1407 TaxID=2692847 RepID=UPI001685C0B1|nr:DUF3239 domain-containing protein [Oscillatoria sp. FACHB-1407]MBD2463834.1 DUF3239 domain-containing protein [Oscillatoria sp. FACHB-1407]